MKTIEKYQCEICGTIHDLRSDAVACEQQGPYDAGGVEIGDIVFLAAGYGWFDGDKRWINNPDVTGHIVGHATQSCPNGYGNCFNECCTYKFYYVVTAIDQDEGIWHRQDHRARIHCATGAMTVKSGHHCGFTFVSTHITPRKIENPPEFVVKDSKRFIGQKGKYLI